MQTQLFHALDISCDHCERTIRKALSALDGVSQVKVDIPSQTVEVQSEKTLQVGRLLETLEEAGYPAEVLKTPPVETAAQNRPSCCAPGGAKHGFGKGGSCHVD